MCDLPRTRFAGRRQVGIGSIDPSRGRSGVTRRMTAAHGPSADRPSAHGISAQDVLDQCEERLLHDGGRFSPPLSSCAPAVFPCSPKPPRMPRPTDHTARCSVPATQAATGRPFVSSRRSWSVALNEHTNPTELRPVDQHGPATIPGPPNHSFPDCPGFCLISKPRVSADAVARRESDTGIG